MCWFPPAALDEDVTSTGQLYPVAFVASGTCAFISARLSLATLSMQHARSLKNP
jgi:hypothetical protein